mmetsp:Transcript_11863/g.27271  ORF Transcript_11863/g.27271 Transcript_11863/m.27271 type:complete len:218 (-) Transcript_11863:1214-1867(-)
MRKSRWNAAPCPPCENRVSFDPLRTTPHAAASSPPSSSQPAASSSSSTALAASAPQSCGWEPAGVETFSTAMDPNVETSSTVSPKPLALSVRWAARAEPVASSALQSSTVYEGSPAAPAELSEITFMSPSSESADTTPSTSAARDRRGGSLSSRPTRAETPVIHMSRSSGEDATKYSVRCCCSCPAPIMCPLIKNRVSESRTSSHAPPSRMIRSTWK